MLMLVDRLFYISRGPTLPSAQDVSRAAAAPSGVVLVVDDNPLIGELVREVLESEGYAVEIAANGAEALELLDRGNPRLVLLDMRMPVMNGWEFAAALAQRKVDVP